MNAKNSLRKIEKLITEQQQIQKSNHPSTEQWQNASKEIHRLASEINKVATFPAVCTIVTFTDVNSSGH